MPRGVLVDEDSIVMVNGTRVPTFFECDDLYLEDCGVMPGDVIAFSFVPDTPDSAVSFRKVRAPTEDELELQREVRASSRELA